MIENFGQRTSKWSSLSSIPFLFLVGFAFPSTSTAQEQDVDARAVWYWSNSCDSNHLQYELWIDGVILHQTVIPLCHRSPDEGNADEGQVRIRFEFSANRPLQWSGYKDEPDTSPAGETITTYVWVKAAESDWMWVGQDFMAEDRNDILDRWNFDVLPYEERSFELPNGIIVKFVPAPK